MIGVLWRTLGAAIFATNLTIAVGSFAVGNPLLGWLNLGAALAVVSVVVPLRGGQR